MKITLVLLAIMAVLVISTTAETTKAPSKGAAKQTEKPKVTEKSNGADKKPAAATTKQSQNGKRSTLSKGQTKSRTTRTGTRQTPKRAKAFY